MTYRVDLMGGRKVCSQWQGDLAVSNACTRCGESAEDHQPCQTFVPHVDDPSETTCGKCGGTLWEHTASATVRPEYRGVFGTILKEPCSSFARINPGSEVCKTCGHSYHDHPAQAEDDSIGARDPEGMADAVLAAGKPGTVTLFDIQKEMMAHATPDSAIQGDAARIRQLRNLLDAAGIDRELEQPQMVHAAAMDGMIYGIDPAGRAWVLDRVWGLDADDPMTMQWEECKMLPPKRLGDDE